MAATGFTISYLGTGSGGCILRNHTAIVLDCPDGSRILLDAASGNTVLRHADLLGMSATDFDHCLLSHSHPDHCEGLPHIEMQRSRRDPDEKPMQLYGSGEALNDIGVLLAYPRRGLTVDETGARRRDGRKVFSFQPTQPGDWLHLTPSVRARCAPVNHIGGAVAWRVEAGRPVDRVFGGHPLVPVVSRACRWGLPVDPRSYMHRRRPSTGRQHRSLHCGRGCQDRSTGWREPTDTDPHRHCFPLQFRTVGGGSPLHFCRTDRRRIRLLATKRVTPNLPANERFVAPITGCRCYPKHHETRHGDVSRRPSGLYPALIPSPNMALSHQKKIPN